MLRPLQQKKGKKAKAVKENLKSRSRNGNYVGRTGTTNYEDNTATLQRTQLILFLISVAQEPMNHKTLSCFLERRHSNTRSASYGRVDKNAITSNPFPIELNPNDKSYAT